MRLLAQQASPLKELILIVDLVALFIHIAFNAAKIVSEKITTIKRHVKPQTLSLEFFGL
jgi:hypothetical protein